jgi:pimeloyl-ACP methyl ester carboxylesterase
MVLGKGHDEDWSRISDCWADNRGVRLHYLDSGRETSGGLVPVVFIPGAMGTAELYRHEIQSLAPRRRVAMSLRGCGKSEAP